LSFTVITWRHCQAGGSAHLAPFSFFREIETGCPPSSRFHESSCGLHQVIRAKKSLQGEGHIGLSTYLIGGSQTVKHYHHWCTCCVQY
jgi:hypothetical protein